MAPRKKSYGIGSAKDVAMKLTPEGQVQILLVLPDQDLVTLVDQMVQNGDIRMSIGEVRKARQSPPHHSKDMRTELSSNGLRSESRNPVLILVSSILNAYDKGNMTSSSIGVSAPHLKSVLVMALLNLSGELVLKGRYRT